MGRQHPVFVYGTLRPGQGSDRRLLAGRTLLESPAFAKGLTLYGTGFPYAVPQPGARIVGDLITIEPTRYRGVLVDALEGYDACQPATSPYIRTTRSVIANHPLPGGGTWQVFHIAWIYLAGPGVSTAGMPRISGDDWLADRS